MRLVHSFGGKILIALKRRDWSTRYIFKGDSILTLHQDGIRSLELLAVREYYATVTSVAFQTSYRNQMLELTCALAFLRSGVLSLDIKRTHLHHSLNIGHPTESKGQTVESQNQ